MPMHSGRGGVTRVEAIVLICTAIPIAMCGCLAIERSRGPSRRIHCQNQLRQIGLALTNHESSKRRYPTCSTADAPLLGPGAAAPGCPAGPTAAGYSWLVQILPFTEELQIYSEIREASDKYRRKTAFDPTMVRPQNTRHFSQVVMPHLQCPSSSGSSTALAPCYASVATGQVAVGNYVALAGTHLDRGGHVVEDGILVSTQENFGKGFWLEDIADGVSNTVIATESREEHVASWYDGQATWVTALRTHVLLDGGEDADGCPLVPPGSLALNDGSADGGPASYLDRVPFTGGNERHWGPSSEHEGGVVVHVFADTRVLAISDQIDAGVYYRLITRDGGEPVDLDQL